MAAAGGGTSPGRTMIRSMLCACAVGLLAAGSTAAQVGATRADVDRVFARFSTAASPGCALAVLEGDELRYARGYGVANLETGSPVTAGTVFDIGSLAKQFTAMAVLLLAADGRLGLDDDVRRFLPELPDYGTTITVRDLLQHTSGLRNYTELFALAGVAPVSLTTTRDALELVARQRGVNFPAGSEFLYSDTNYFLAGEIVRRVSGQSLREFSAQRIFRPLAMDHTQVADVPRAVVAGRATGYEPLAEGWRSGASNFEQVGDGAVLTTVLDLARWERNFATHVVGGPATVELLTRPGQLRSGESLAHGMGVFTDRYRGVPRQYHDGEWAGYRAAVTRLPTLGIAVIVACNQTGDADPMALALTVVDLTAGSRLEPRPQPAAVDPAAPGRAGLFWSPALGSLRRFEVRDGALTLAGASLEPVGPDRYRSAGDGRSEYRFLTGAAAADGELEVLRFGVAARYFRVPQGPAPASDARDFAGSYHAPDLPSAWNLVVEGDRLLRRAPYLHDVELDPVFADTYLASSGEGTCLLHFVRDVRGRVNGVLVSSETLRPLLLVRDP